MGTTVKQVIQYWRPVRMSRPVALHGRACGASRGAPCATRGVRVGLRLLVARGADGAPPSAWSTAARRSRPCAMRGTSAPPRGGRVLVRFQIVPVGRALDGFHRKRSCVPLDARDGGAGYYFTFAGPSSPVPPRRRRGRRGSAGRAQPRHRRDAPPAVGARGPVGGPGARGRAVVFFRGSRRSAMLLAAGACCRHPAGRARDPQVALPIRGRRPCSDVGVAAANARPPRFALAARLGPISARTIAELLRTRLSGPPGRPPVVIVSSYIAVFALAGASLGADVPASPGSPIAPLVPRLGCSFPVISIGRLGRARGARSAGLCFPAGGPSDASIESRDPRYFCYGLTETLSRIACRGLALLFLRRRGM